MVELIAKTPFDGALPLEVGTVSASEVDTGVLTSVAPYKGKNKALSEALKGAHGMAAPAPNRATGKEGSRAIWFGREMVLLCGPEPDAKLGKHAALTDQSDAWAVARLEGENAAQVLARLTPIDLRPGVFKRGHTARTELQHMMASITRIGERSYQIMVFRAFAQTLAHDLKIAMQGVAARQPR
ncbi:Sarcosine oxidase, gamma subunit family [Roseovarius albus]|uniref:Sarcosine oxidase, gamma subunit family n=1 Tax=Roseovarius albus TaxID=1247867 RepID=A0A1X6Y9E5_9RHOB|nr:sarcosine oxidase subunit gamma [Roseovarius albus]SLN13897.1 Sarcosine oxidase, gamma subunit family [Roseovarius albus]